MQNSPEPTALQAKKTQSQQNRTRHMGLRVTMGGQGILRRISGPEVLPLEDVLSIHPEPEAATDSVAISDPQSSATTEDVERAELEEAIDLLVGQEIMSFLVISVMHTNAIGGMLLAQHTYLKQHTTIHAIDVAMARAHAKLNLQRLRAAKRIQHPNLISVLHHATHRRFILVFREPTEGVSIADLLTQQAPLPESRALTIVQGICDALTAGYEEGLTHGGVCPEHIFIGSSGQPKLIDYCWHLYTPEGGIDPFQCSQSIDGSVAQWTRAPELSIDTDLNQDADAEVGPRADLYSLGATFYQMVTGQQLQGSLKNPHQVNPSLSRETSDIIAAMIQTHPDRRINSYPELRQLLQLRLSGKRGKPTRGNR